MNLVEAHELVRGGVPSEFNKYRHDIVGFVNDLCYTYDPRKVTEGGSPDLPFKTWEKQEEFLLKLDEWWSSGKSFVCEKCRDAGATELICSWILHKWLFHPGFAAGLGSRKEELLDGGGDTKTLFFRIRYKIQRLPEKLRPKGWDEKSNSRHMFLKNPENGATIVGEAGDNIGRGGRTSVYLCDEFAFVERAQAAIASLTNNTTVMGLISTHNGVGTQFHQACESGAYEMFQFRWKDDPRKSESWYEDQKKKLDAVDFAQEVECNVYGSVENVVIPNEWVQASINRELKTTASYICGYDVAAGGKNECVLVARKGPVVTKVSTWKESNTTVQAEKLIALAEMHNEKNPARKIRQINVDGTGVGVGVTSALERKLESEEKQPFHAVAVLWGSGASDSVWAGSTKSSRERFLNRRAEDWWRVRVRFEKTYEKFVLGKDHPEDECISIPDDPVLIKQLSMVTWATTESGKTKVESKNDLSRRGVSSPDRADALVLAFSEDEQEPRVIRR